MKMNAMWPIRIVCRLSHLFITSTLSVSSGFPLFRMNSKQMSLSRAVYSRETKNFFRLFLLFRRSSLMRRHQSYFQCIHKSTKNENRNNKKRDDRSAGTASQSISHRWPPCLLPWPYPMVSRATRDNAIHVESEIKVNDRRKWNENTAKAHRSVPWMAIGIWPEHWPCVGDRIVTMPYVFVTHLPLFPNKPCIARIDNILVLASLRTGLWRSSCWRHRTENTFSILLNSMIMCSLCGCHDYIEFCSRFARPLVCPL